MCVFPNLFCVQAAKRAFRAKPHVQIKSFQQRKYEYNVFFRNSLARTTLRTQVASAEPTKLILSGYHL